MVKRVWQETGLFLLIGVVMTAFAYMAESGFETISWMLAMLIVAWCFMLVNALQRRTTGAESKNDISLSEDLGYEMDLLVQKIENSTTVMLGHVRDELAQMRSLVSDSIKILHDSFHVIDQGSREQNRVVQDMLEDLRFALESRVEHEVEDNAMQDSDNLVDRRIQELTALSQQINQGIANVVRSLQFEDIVQQLTVTSEKHLDYIEAVLDAVDVGIRNLNSQRINVPEYIVGLHELKAQIDQLEAECRAEAERSVSQHSMQQGDISLF